MNIIVLISFDIFSKPFQSQSAIKKQILLSKHNTYKTRYGNEQNQSLFSIWFSLAKLKSET